MLKDARLSTSSTTMTHNNQYRMGQRNDVKKLFSSSASSIFLGGMCSITISLQNINSSTTSRKIKDKA